MNGEFLRGEVYWICLDDSIGYEEKTGRPGVIVSADGLNKAAGGVTIAFLSKHGLASATRPSIADPQGVRMRVLCDQLRTVDTSRLSKYMFAVNESELTRITGALACVLCLPAPKPERKISNSESDDKCVSLQVQVDMWRRMYETTLDQLVTMRVAADITRKTDTYSEKQTDIPEEPDVEPERVEINTCSVEDLVNCGCTLPLARLIVSYRPYKVIGDLRRVPGVKSVTFAILKNKVCCVPCVGDAKPKMVEQPKEVESQEPEATEKSEWDGKKININTVGTATELKEKTGMAMRSATEIVRTRKIVGRYEKLEDLLALDHFGEISMKRYGHMLEV